MFPGGGSFATLPVRRRYSPRVLFAPLTELVLVTELTLISRSLYCSFLADGVRSLGANLGGRFDSLIPKHLQLKARGKVATRKRRTFRISALETPILQSGGVGFAFSAYKCYLAFGAPALNLH